MDQHRESQARNWKKKFQNRRADMNLVQHKISGWPYAPLCLPRFLHSVMVARNQSISIPDFLVEKHFSNFICFSFVSTDDNRDDNDRNDDRNKSDDDDDDEDDDDTVCFFTTATKEHLISRVSDELQSSAWSQIKGH